MAYTLRVHQYTDTLTGHVNIEYIENGVSKGFYGATPTQYNGFGLEGGVFLQTTGSLNRISNYPNAHTFVDINVNSVQFNEVYNYAVGQAHATAYGVGDYDLIGKNCVDFLGENLNRVGIGDYHASQYLLQKDSMTSSYAEFKEFFHWNPYEALTNNYWDQYTYQMNPISYDFAVRNASVSIQYGNETLMYEYQFFCWFETNLGKSSDSEEVAETCEESYWSSPIAIDLDNNGIKTLSAESANVSFDITGDGIAERTGWLDGGDGFLVQDLNGNGTIDSVNEMFGGRKRGVGFAELGALDSNGDGIISADDASFSSIAIWQDINQNGTTDEGEIQSLSAHGVSTLNLSYNTTHILDNGNMIGEVSSAIKHGQATELSDVYFHFLNNSSRPNNAGATIGTQVTTNAAVSSIVNAIATFDPPTSAEITSSDTYQTDLLPTLAVA